MAQINIQELIALIQAQPEYNAKWKRDVPANTALYIRFAEGKMQGISSEVLELVNGSELVLDRRRDGKIVGIEII